MRAKNLKKHEAGINQPPTRHLLPVVINRYWLVFAFVCHILSIPFAAANVSGSEFAFNYQNSFIENGNTVAEEIHQLSGLADVRTWQININKSLLSKQSGDQIRILLPDGKMISVVLSSNQQLSNGDTQLIGEFTDDGRMVITVNDKASFGSIINQQHKFVISWVNGVGQILLDQNSLKEDAIDLGADQMLAKNFVAGNLQKSLKSSGFNSIAAANKGGISQVDMLIVYSSEFKNLFSSPVTRINQLLGFSNNAFARSGILIELKLAAAVEIPFNNNANIGTMLTAATNGTGDFNQLHALRDKYGADLVAVLPASPGFSASGVAWVNGDNQSIGYSVTRLSPGCCDSVFAHEVGHNLGSGHEHQSANPNQNSPCSGGVTGFACGHGDSALGWGTIMSNLNGRAIDYKFSNLDSDCLGQPCGIAQGLPNAADNRSSFNISRIQVANFRASITLPPPKPEIVPGKWLPAILFSILAPEEQP